MFKRGNSNLKNYFIRIKLLESHISHRIEYRELRVEKKVLFPINFDKGILLYTCLSAVIYLKKETHFFNHCER